MNNVYVVDLAEGMRQPLHADDQSALDQYSNNGQYIPMLQVLDMANVLPTPEGYTSAFANAKRIGTVDLPEVQELILLKTFNGIPLAIAFTPNGLYACGLANPDGAPVQPTTITPFPEGENANGHLTRYRTLPAGFGWTKIAYSTAGPISPWAWWTRAVVANNIYFYQQGLGYILQISDDGTSQTVVLRDLSPSFIIGQADVNYWDITLDFTTDPDASITQELGFTGLTNIVIPNVNKTNVAATLPQQWRTLITSLWGLSVQEIGDNEQ